LGEKEITLQMTCEVGQGQPLCFKVNLYASVFEVLVVVVPKRSRPQHPFKYSPSIVEKDMVGVVVCVCSSRLECDVSFINTTSCFKILNYLSTHEWNC